MEQIEKNRRIWNYKTIDSICHCCDILASTIAIHTRIQPIMNPLIIGDILNYLVMSYLRHSFDETTFHTGLAPCAMIYRSYRASCISLIFFIRYMP